MPHTYRNIFSPGYDAAVLYNSHVDYRKPRLIVNLAKLCNKYNVTSRIDESRASTAVFNLLSTTAEVMFHTSLYGQDFGFLKTLSDVVRVGPETKSTHYSKDRRDRQSSEDEVKTRAANLVCYFSEKLSRHYLDTGVGKHEETFFQNLKNVSDALQQKPELKALLDETLCKLLILNADSKGSGDCERFVGSTYQAMLSKKLVSKVKKTQKVDMVSGQMKTQAYLTYSFLLLDSMCVEFLRNINDQLGEGETKYSITPVAATLLSNSVADCPNLSSGAPCYMHGRLGYHNFADSIDVPIRRMAHVPGRFMRRNSCC